MKAFAEAPGKVIIAGEHFVVHGAWALAAAVSRRVRVEIEESSSLRITSDRFRGVSHPALKPVAEVVEHLCREHSLRPSFRIKITSEIPEGSGLGSSAATTVAVATALSRLKSLGLGRDGIIAASMVGEKSIHGHPSGIDSNICARGGVLLFKPGSRPKVVRPAPGFSLIVSNSGTVRDTGRLVKGVSESRSRDPQVFEALASTAGGVSLLAAEKLRSGDRKGLGMLLSFNQVLLSAIGVSTPGLDDLVEASISLGSYGAKLTGAGGGGCVLSVAAEGKEKRITSGLNARGNDTFRSALPVGGVRSWRSQ